MLSEITKNYPKIASTLIFDDFMKINLDKLEILKKNKT